ncbi:MAG: hypothetical protein NVS3B2_18370 [Ramlibacter sp.]
MDGYTAAARIRALEGVAGRIPIVAVTAHALAGEREKCLAAGMDDYIAKPVRPAAVYQVIERWARGISDEVQADPPISDQATVHAGFDPSVLADLREVDQDGGLGLVAEVVKLFLRDAPARLAEIRSAVRERDGVRLRTVAHALKGSGACVGATRIATLGAQLEELALSDTLQGAGGVVDELEAELGRIRIVLQGVATRQ